MPRVSVIIPFYNVENYITQCIESLLCQELDDCEFIFVNDGSKDNSRQIVEKYKKLDRRILLINQENQGVSMARNTGLSVAVGEYIGFVDADDEIEKDMYRILFESAKQSDCDVVISNLESEIEGHKVITKYPFPVDVLLKEDFIKQEILQYFLMSDQLNTVSNKIYKQIVIRNNKISFPEKVALGEDGLFNMQFFSNAKIARYIEYTGYHYREVPGSATRNILEKDYFNRALEVFTSKYPEKYLEKISDPKIQRLKSIKLIKSVMSYVHIYFTPSEELSFCKRCQWIRKMLTHKYVRRAITDCYNEIYSSAGRYEKFIIDMIKRQSILGLYCAVSYSRFKNK